MACALFLSPSVGEAGTGQRMSGDAISRWLGL